MISQDRRFDVAISVFVFVALLICAGTARAQTCSGGKITVKLSIDAAKNCSQQASDQAQPTDLVPLSSNQCVVWVTAAAIGFDLLFPAGSSPFYEFKGKKVKSPPGAGAAGTKSFYDSLTVNGKPCNNAQQLGIVMR